MKKEQWKIVMFFALLFMLIGAGISFWGLETNKDKITFAGVLMIMSVCVSWWFWVMFVIKSIIKNTESTCTRLTEIMNGIGEMKKLLKEEESAK